MAARGSILKGEISKKILEIFPGSFLYNDGKEIRINGIEDGSPLQIKVSLTAAKTPVEGGEDVAVPSEKVSATAASNEKVPQEPTEEEKERLRILLDKLGLQ